MQGWSLEGTSTPASRNLAASGSPGDSDWGSGSRSEPDDPNRVNESEVDDRDHGASEAWNVESFVHSLGVADQIVHDDPDVTPTPQELANWATEQFAHAPAEFAHGDDVVTEDAADFDFRHRLAHLHPANTAVYTGDWEAEFAAVAGRLRWREDTHAKADRIVQDVFGEVHEGVRDLVAEQIYADGVTRTENGRILAHWAHRQMAVQQYRNRLDSRNFRTEEARAAAWETAYQELQSQELDENTHRLAFEIVEIVFGDLPTMTDAQIHNLSETQRRVLNRSLAVASLVGLQIEADRGATKNALDFAEWVDKHQRAELQDDETFDEDALFNDDGQPTTLGHGEPHDHDGESSSDHGSGDVDATRYQAPHGFGQGRGSVAFHNEADAMQTRNADLAPADRTFPVSLVRPPMVEPQRPGRVEFKSYGFTDDTTRPSLEVMQALELQAERLADAIVFRHRRGIAPPEVVIEGGGTDLGDERRNNIAALLEVAVDRQLDVVQRDVDPSARITRGDTRLSIQKSSEDANRTSSVRVIVDGTVAASAPSDVVPATPLPSAPESAPVVVEIGEDGEIPPMDDFVRYVAAAGLEHHMVVRGGGEQGGPRRQEVIRDLTEAFNAFTHGPNAITITDEAGDGPVTIEVDWSRPETQTRSAAVPVDVDFSVEDGRAGTQGGPFVRVGADTPPSAPGSSGVEPVPAPTRGTPTQTRGDAVAAPAPTEVDIPTTPFAAVQQDEPAIGLATTFDGVRDVDVFLAGSLVRLTDTFAFMTVLDKVRNRPDVLRVIVTARREEPYGLALIHSVDFPDARKLSDAVRSRAAVGGDVMGLLAGIEHDTMSVLVLAEIHLAVHGRDLFKDAPGLADAVRAVPAEPPPRSDAIGHRAATMPRRSYEIGQLERTLWGYHNLYSSDIRFDDIRFDILLTNTRSENVRLRYGHAWVEIAFPIGSSGLRGRTFSAGFWPEGHVTRTAVQPGELRSPDFMSVPDVVVPGRVTRRELDRGLVFIRHVQNAPYYWLTNNCTAFAENLYSKMTDRKISLAGFDGVMSKGPAKYRVRDREIPAEAFDVSGTIVTELDGLNAAGELAKFVNAYRDQLVAGLREGLPAQPVRITVPKSDTREAARVRYDFRFALERELSTALPKRAHRFVMSDVPVVVRNVKGYTGPVRIEFPPPVFPSPVVVESPQREMLRGVGSDDKVFYFTAGDVRTVALFKNGQVVGASFPSGRRGVTAAQHEKFTVAFAKNADKETLSQVYTVSGGGSAEQGVERWSAAAKAPWSDEQDPPVFIDAHGSGRSVDVQLNSGEIVSMALEAFAKVVARTAPIRDAMWGNPKSPVVLLICNALQGAATEINRELLAQGLQVRVYATDGQLYLREDGRAGTQGGPFVRIGADTPPSAPGSSGVEPVPAPTRGTPTQTRGGTDSSASSASSVVSHPSAGHTIGT
ncbi:hypothetical protein ABZX92_44800 [Lentzea sp. NPDC006480]|uniref:hypothetical protein n=1 Tax=Lentzea sp. NPDC006480 TaxID=3157176 RepID=UPI0033BD4EB9